MEKILELYGKKQILKVWFGSLGYFGCCKFSPRKIYYFLPEEKRTLWAGDIIAQSPECMKTARWTNENERDFGQIQQWRQWPPDNCSILIGACNLILVLRYETVENLRLCTWQTPSIHFVFCSGIVSKTHPVPLVVNYVISFLIGPSKNPTMYHLSEGTRPCPSTSVMVNGHRRVTTQEVSHLIGLILGTIPYAK